MSLLNELSEFAVTGARKDTGVDVTIVVAASDIAAAELVARSQGIFVERVEKISKPNPNVHRPAGQKFAAVATPNSKRLSRDERTMVGAGVGVLVVLLVCGGLITSRNGTSEPANSPMPTREYVPDETERIARSRGLDPKAFNKVARDEKWNVETQKAMADAIAHQEQKERERKSDYSR